MKDLESTKSNECEKDVSHIKTVYRLHLVYIVIICGIVMICTLCVIPRCVSVAAFQNFSFASTIVSIVLAVVSIVYSLWSGQKSNNQYTGIANIERKIDEQLQGFSHIEQSISDKLNPIKNRFDQLTEDQTRTRSEIQELKSLLGDNHITSSHSDKYNLSNYPTFANIALYALCLSKLTNKKIPTKVLEKAIGNYWIGFMVAMSRQHPEKLKYSPKGDSVIITTYDTSFFPDHEKILSELNKSTESFGTLLGELEHYFSESNSD